MGDMITVNEIPEPTVISLIDENPDLQDAIFHLINKTIDFMVKHKLPYMTLHLPTDFDRPFRDNLQIKIFVGDKISFTIEVE